MSESKQAERVQDPERLRFRTGAVAAVAAAHFIHDIFTAFPAPLLPLIIDRLGLTLFQAGSLIVCVQLPSLLNPFLGSLVDRGSFHRALVIVTPGATGVLICLIGLAPSYAVLAVLLLTVGFSVAAIHVGGPVMVGRLSGQSVGRGMSFFMFGGEMARTVGPLVAVQAVSTFGLDGMWQVAPVAVASSVVLWWRLGDVPYRTTERKPSKILAVWKNMRQLLVSVIGILLARAFMVGAMCTFLPTFIYGEVSSLWVANIALAVLELGGAAGAFVSGALSDRVGRRRVLLYAVSLSPPLMFLFLVTGGPARLLVLAALGFAILSTTPVLLAMVIENSGADQAAATGTYMMFGFAARSVILLVVGAMGDALGLRMTFALCAALSCLAIPFVLILPRR